MFKVIRSNRPEVKIWHIYDVYTEKRHLETLSDHQIIALIVEIGTEYNGDLRILTASPEIAISVHAQWECGQNSS